MASRRMELRRDALVMPNAGYHLLSPALRELSPRFPVVHLLSHFVHRFPARPAAVQTAD
jgi:hypothetical protein